MEKSVLLRLLLLLGSLLVAGIAFETIHLQGYVAKTGKVFEVTQSPVPSKTDDTRYHVSYTINGDQYRNKTTLGIVSNIWTLRNLSKGDSVQILVDPDQPRQTIINSVGNKYPFTMSVTALLIILLSVVYFRLGITRTRIS